MNSEGAGERVSVGEFALAFSLRGTGRHWAVLMSPDRSLCRVAASELVEELRGASTADAELVELADDLPRALSAAAASTLVVVSPSGGEEFDWASLDRDRNRLPADRRVVLVVTAATFEAIQRDAPNLASWIGGNVAHADLNADVLTSEHREELLAQLRTKYALSDDELVARAERREAPAEPDVAVWLVLLGRGDLV